MSRASAFWLVLMLVPKIAAALPISFSVNDKTDIYGADLSHTGSTVRLKGLSGILEVPETTLSGAFEIPVGLLSLTTSDPLSRNLPLGGWNEFSYPILVTIDGLTKEIIQTLHFNQDGSNDSLYVQGDHGVTDFLVRPGLKIEFQFLTASVPAANAGETKMGNLIAQFYGIPFDTPVPEPAILPLMAIGLVGLGRSRRTQVRAGSMKIKMLDYWVARCGAIMTTASGAATTVTPVKVTENSVPVKLTGTPVVAVR